VFVATGVLGFTEKKTNFFVVFWQPAWLNFLRWNSFTGRTKIYSYKLILKAGNYPGKDGLRKETEKRKKRIHEAAPR
jgi:hypothetical protein